MSLMAQADASQVAQNVSFLYLSNSCPESAHPAVVSVPGRGNWELEITCGSQVPGCRKLPGQELETVLPGVGN